LGGSVEIGKEAAGLDLRAPGGRVNRDVFHEREIDHEAVVADGIAGDVMTATPDGNEELLCAPKSHCLDDIGGRLAAGDESWFAIDHRVPDLADFVVAVITGKDDFAVEILPQSLDGRVASSAVFPS
jgi:hypothetical protein